MKKSPWIKALTIGCFLLFITTFVLYRSGQLDAWLDNEKPSIQTSPNGSNIAANTIDTTKPATPDSTQQRIMMSSSKSMVLIEKPSIFKNTLRLKKRLDSMKRETIMMSSSKSGIIFKPVKLSDSIKTDTAKLRLQKQ